MKRVEGSIDIVEQRADILFAKNILPRRHRGSGQAFPDRVGNALPASVRHEVRIAQVARMRFEELAYPVFSGAIGAVAKGAVVLEQAFAFLFATVGAD